MLDATDRAIIEALQENGREAFRRIAARIGVAEATVRSRYGRLVRDGVLQVTGVTNPLGLGFDTIALLGIKCNGAPDRLADEISTWEESSYVVIAAGRYDVLAELVCDHRDRLVEITNRVRRLPGVVSTETFLYLQLAKQVFTWGTRRGEEHRPEDAL